MEVQGSAMKFAKRIVQLEAQCGLLEETNINLKEEIMEVKGKEEKMKELYLRFMDKYAKVKEKYQSEGRKWSVEEERIREECMQLMAEKKKLEIDLKEALREMGDSVEEMVTKLKAVEAESEGLKNLLEEKDGIVAVLLAKNKTLETQNSRLQMDFKAKRQKLEEKILELAQKIHVLEDSNNQAENMAIDVANKLEAEAKGLKSLLKEKDGVLTTLLAKNENLETRNSRLEMDLHANMATEVTRQKLEEEKLVELSQKIRVLEAECCKVKEDNRNETEKMAMDVAKKLKAAKSEAEGLKSLLEEKDGMFTTLLAKNEILVTQNSRLESDFQAKMAVEVNMRKLEEKIVELTQKIRVLEDNNNQAEKMAIDVAKTLKAVEAEAEGLKSLLEEKEGICTILLTKNETLETQNSRLEMDFQANIANEAKRRKLEEEKVVELAQTIRFLEDNSNEAEKMAMDVERKLKVAEAEAAGLKSLLKEKDDMLTRLLVRNETLEMQNSRLQSDFQAKMTVEVNRWKLEPEKAVQLAQKIWGLEDNCNATEKMAMDVERKLKAIEAEAEGLKSLLEEKDGALTALLVINETLGTRNNRLEMEIQANATTEAKRQKLEEEKLVELSQKIRVLEAEYCKVKEDNRNETAKILNLNKAFGVLNRVKEAEKRAIEDIERILNKKTPMKEKHTKDILSLALRPGILEKDRPRLEAEIRETDERIKALPSSVELPQLDHPASRVDIVCALATQNQGPKSVRVRKLEDLGSSVEKRIRTKKCKPKWESASEMCDAFTTNDELCMRSVCALYRKHKSLGSRKNCSPSSNTAFKPIHETMRTALGELLSGMALGELLTNEDPQGSMKESLSKFKRAHPLDLEECRLIARYHHMELFEIYNSNLDPLFMHDEC